MLSIILFILKIIGWILLAILGLLLLILSAILFGAIRYRAEGAFRQKQFKGSLKVTWLYPLFSFSGSWGEDGHSGSARLMGIRIWSSEKNTDADEEEDWDDEQPMVEIQEAVQTEQTDRSQDAGQKKNVDKRLPENTPNSSHEPKRRQPLLERAARKIRFSFARICDKLKTIQRRWEAARGWIEDEANRKSVRLTITQIKKVVRHLLPRKGAGRVTFGLDDPYLTGMILKYAALFYPLYGEQIEIFPEFDETVFEAEGWMRGHIRIGVVAGCFLRLLADNNIRKQILGWIKR